MIRNNPQTSLDAYKSLKHSEVRQTYLDILGALDVLGRGTFEDIAAFLKCSRDKIWKRLSEMERMQMIYKPGTKKMLKSGRNGYEWMRTTPAKTEKEKDYHYKKGEKTSTDFSKELIQSTQTKLF